jgi:hypothetical protein
LASNPTATVPEEEEIWTDIIEAWDAFLERIPTERLVECFKLAMVTRSEKWQSFPVNASEILAAWKHLTKPHVESPEAAWAIALQCLRASGFGKRPLFCDDPLIRKCVEAIGANAIGLNERDEARKRFVWMYKEETAAFRERVEIDPSYQLPAPKHRMQLKAARVQVLQESAPDYRYAKEGFRSLLQVLEAK